MTIVTRIGDIRGCVHHNSLGIIVCKRIVNFLLAYLEDCNAGCPK